VWLDTSFKWGGSYHFHWLTFTTSWVPNCGRRSNLKALAPICWFLKQCLSKCNQTQSPTWKCAATWCQSYSALYSACVYWRMSWTLLWILTKFCTKELCLTTSVGGMWMELGEKLELRGWKPKQRSKGKCLAQGQICCNYVAKYAGIDPIICSIDGRGREHEPRLCYTILVWPSVCGLNVVENRCRQPKGFHEDFPNH